MEYTIECREKTLTIQQNTDGKHGSTVWDAAIILCKYFDLHQTTLIPSNPIVIDLGCGTGIVGLYIASLLDQMRVKSTVFLTDCEGLDLVEKNVAGFESEIVDVCTSELVWGSDTDLKGDVIVASDCIVSPEAYEPLIKTLVDVSKPDSTIFLAYEKRKFDVEAEFFKMLSEFFRFSLVKEEDLDERWRAPEDIFLFQLYKKKFNI